jgi:PadR family transcriptional regulator, regulatory protein PadR
MTRDEAPLREPTLFILTALAGGPRHGYGIIGEVERLSAGRVRLRAGTLYGALERLEASGYVEIDGVSQDGGPPRTNYRLTDTGRRRLDAELTRLEDTVAVARSQLRLDPT